MTRFTQFPRDLAAVARTMRFGDVPVLLAHPDWNSAAPACLWLHGRTANKELDPGRYLRWIRAGIAAIAIDLPRHGERADAAMLPPEASLEVMAQAIQEIDTIIAALRSSEFGPSFDFDRLALGGMSLGGMAALRRLCDPHPFKAAAVEGTAGWLEGIYLPEHNARASWTPETIARTRTRIGELSASSHLEAFRPIPLLALHSEADMLIPFSAQSEFIARLRNHYRASGADPALIQFQHWPKTGAPQEHIGFGLMSNDAKNMQTEFLSRTLAP